MEDLEDDLDDLVDDVDEAGPSTAKRRLATLVRLHYLAASYWITAHSICANILFVYGLRMKGTTLC